MPRFFVDIPLCQQQRLVLPVAAGHHATRALRLDVGDSITLFNGLGGEFHACITGVDRAGVVVDVGHFDAREAELPVRIAVAQGLSAGDKMDWAIEKSVELGAESFQPLSMERSVVRLSAERSQKKHAHWRALVESASAQCGRNKLMLIEPTAPFSAWLSDQPRDNLRLLLSPTDTAPIQSIGSPKPGQLVTLLVGPEGGLGAREDAMARAEGFSPVTLGPRVLRTETAAAAAIAMLAGLWLGHG